MNSEDLSVDEITQKLESRLGHVLARRRLSKEKRHEARAVSRGLTFFHIENLPISRAVIEIVLRLSGTYWRGRSNAAKVRLRNNEVFSERLPPQFDGFTILHIRDFHPDMSADALTEAARLVSGLQYDLCVLTGDYRGRTYGEFHSTLREMLRLREVLTGAIYGVLGNHDTIMMVPDLERMSIRMLLNEH